MWRVVLEGGIETNRENVKLTSFVILLFLIINAKRVIWYWKSISSFMDWPNVACIHKILFYTTVRYVVDN